MANKKRLIDADALIAEYDRVHIGAPGGARKLMEDAPTVDAEIVTHGRWIIKYIKNSKYHYAYCSECETMGSPQWRRCPVCEAKMDGGNEDG